jgi:hypothetical protein
MKRYTIPVSIEVESTDFGDPDPRMVAALIKHLLRKGLEQSNHIDLDTNFNAARLSWGVDFHSVETTKERNPFVVYEEASSNCKT